MGPLSLCEAAKILQGNMTIDIYSADLELSTDMTDPDRWVRRHRHCIHRLPHVHAP